MITRVGKRHIPHIETSHLADQDPEVMGDRLEGESGPFEDLSLDPKKHGTPRIRRGSENGSHLFSHNTIHTVKLQVLQRGQKPSQLGPNLQVVHHQELGERLLVEHRRLRQLQD